MKRVLMLTGDINLMNVTDPQVPFARIKDTLRQADVLFGNLECCFHEPGVGHPVEREGFYAPLASAQALVIGGFHAGARFGFVQRTSVYWPTGHEATDTSPGVAVLTGRTAYEAPLHVRRASVP